MAVNLASAWLADISAAQHMCPAWPKSIPRLRPKLTGRASRDLTQDPHRLKRLQEPARGNWRWLIRRTAPHRALTISTSLSTVTRVLLSVDGLRDTVAKLPSEPCPAGSLLTSATLAARSEKLLIRLDLIDAGGNSPSLASQPLL